MKSFYVFRAGIVLCICLLSFKLYPQFNYGEALQKSIFFYEAQQSGPLPDWNRVSWRDDSAVNDGSDVGHDLTGGWYDAGDHVKFGFPMAYSTTVLAWGVIEYEDAYANAGQLDEIKRNLRFVCDYFMKCHTAPNEFYAQVGDGGDDHAWWGSAEVMPMARPSSKVDISKPGSDVAGETAAALAACSMVFKNSDPVYSAQLLSHAKQLYDFADTYRGKYSDAIPGVGQFYNSWSGYNDEIVWGAAWLYLATNDNIYLNKAETEYDNLNTEPQSDTRSYRWGLAWDDKSYGIYILLSKITGDQKYKTDAERSLDFWTTGYNGERVSYSPGGQAHLTQWGSLRHAVNTAFLAFVYSDFVDTPKAQTYHDFAVRQVNYTLGDNPRNSSYMIGFGNNPPLNPHHRTAHGTWTNNLNGEPADNRHIIYGALVGGPSSANDAYEDDRGDYIANEVACDYNACYTGALARMYQEFGGNPLTNFPPQETPVAEFLSDAKFNSNNAGGVTVSVMAKNHSAWPAKTTSNLSFRYYFDISEALAQGYGIDDYNISLSYAEGNGQLAIKEYDIANGIYYAEVSFPNDPVAPIGETPSRREAQLSIRVQAGMPWDISNDYSAQELSGSTRKNSIYIPLYDGNQLLQGAEPDGGDVPNAVITVDNTSGVSPLTVVFDGTGSTDPNGDNLDYNWNFGNGESSTDATASVEYLAPGNYDVALTVTDPDGNSDIDTITIEVIDGNVAPVADITADPISGIAPLTVSFDASGSSDANGDSLTYSWNFGDGSTGTGAIVSHTFMSIDDYNVALTVSDGSKEDTATIAISVNNGIEGGIIQGGPFTFIVGDGTADYATGITLSDNLGANSQWVVTDDQGQILGLPNAPENVNFDEASGGICLIWHISYADDLLGLEVGQNTADLIGDFDFSNSISVVREPYVEPGDCTFETPLSNALPSINSSYQNIFVLGDGGPQLTNVTTFTINWDLNNNGLYQLSMNTNNGNPNWYIDLRDSATYTLNTASPEITFSDTGLAGLDGSYWVAKDEENFVLVSKTNGFSIYFSKETTEPTCSGSTPDVNGGTLAGGPFSFTVQDGTPDYVSDITLTGNTGSFSQWIITDDNGVILGLPSTPEDVNFDEADAGTCLIWHLSYEEGLLGAEVGNNASNLEGIFDLSNSISVFRTLDTGGPIVDGGTISGGPFSLTVQDGIPDYVSGITLSGNSGTFSQWVVTNEDGVILGLPDAPIDVNFDEAEAGTCLIWHLSHEDDLQGAALGNNASNLTGTFDLSNSITVIRTTATTGGDCNFGTPVTNPLPSISQEYTHIFVLGNGGPNLDNIQNFRLNWELQGNRLNQISIQTNNGVPGWYIDLKSNTSQSFAQSQPTITLTNTGITGFDGSYYVNTEGDNFIMVSQSADFTIYFSTVSTQPQCSGTANNNDPIARITATPDVGEPPLLVSFDASTSSDEDGGDLSYAWDFGDGTTAIGVAADHEFTAEGQYVVTLTVTDEGGRTGTATKTIRVESVIVTPPGDNAYINRFIELRDEFYNPLNGYFSADGSPHHSIETLIVEAPDYGHESTSELYSYWLQLEAMNGRISGDWEPLSDVWEAMEKFIIPTAEDQPNTSFYSPSSPATYAPEFPEPSFYPAPLNFSTTVGTDPVSADLQATYGSGVYQMHWLLDNDNFYGYGNRGDGTSTPSYINTFQRGEQESVYETIPHPSWEDFTWGGENGFLPLFAEDQSYSKQWRYTSAPDADARVVQAMYWAQQYAKDQGVSLSQQDLDRTAKMGDYLRLAMFDKYFMKMGAQSTDAGTGYDSAHYLMSWYISWGGATPPGQWSWRISSSHCHFGYQNPVAAYALTNIDALKPKSSNGEDDWKVSLQRQLEFYTWLQSAEGGIAGGATNSWNGDYSPYPSGKSTFYGMAFDKDPVYHDPGSGTWFGWQAWSMERIAEYYYITNDPKAKVLIDKWVTWVKNVIQLVGDNDFNMPATLEWSGEPDNWNPDNPGSNNNLHVMVTDYGKDLGIAASTAKALIYYAAATRKHADATFDTDARDLAKEILDRMWNTYRDDKGVSAPESRGDFSRMFTQEVYVPDGFSGAMANGDEIKPGVSFLDIRSNYKDDPEFAKLEAAYNAGEEYTQRYHRSWAQIEVALANAEYGFFFEETGNRVVVTNTVERPIVSAYPNPAKDFITITTGFDLKNSKVKIVDLTGTVIKTEVIKDAKKSERISLNGLPNGFYIIEVQNPETGNTEKLKVIKN